jgi:hypothetical protein
VSYYCFQIYFYIIDAGLLPHFQQHVTHLFFLCPWQCCYHWRWWWSCGGSWWRGTSRYSCKGLHVAQDEGSGITGLFCTIDFSYGKELF